MESLARKLRRKFCSRVFLDRGGDIHRTILVAGAARSGTTWIADIINYANEYRMIFEPFHPEKMPIVGGFRRNQYLPVDCVDGRFVEPALKILSGRMRNAWSDQYNTKINADQRIVKDIRANFLVGWIHARVPAMPIVLVVRHPCAVYASRKAMNWSVGLSGVLDQPELMRDHLIRFQSMMRTEQDELARHVMFWCAQYFVPLRQLPVDAYYVACYERFCVQPEAESKNLFAHLGKEWRPEVARTFAQPSLVSRPQSSIVTGSSQPDQWRNGFTDALMRRVHEILTAFGLDRLYDRHGQPCDCGTSQAAVEERVGSGDNVRH